MCSNTLIFHPAVVVFTIRRVSSPSSVLALDVLHQRTVLPFHSREYNDRASLRSTVNPFLAYDVRRVQQRSNHMEGFLYDGRSAKQLSRSLSGICNTAPPPSGTPHLNSRKVRRRQAQFEVSTLFGRKSQYELIQVHKRTQRCVSVLSLTVSS